MAKKKTDDESALETAAKKIGEAAGKVAAAVGVKPSTPKKEKIGKLEKKNKSRLPRKEKKAKQKAAAKLGA
jgi:hypothetical protein